MVARYTLQAVPLLPRVKAESLRQPAQFSRTTQHLPTVERFMPSYRMYIWEVEHVLKKIRPVH